MDIKAMRKEITELIDNIKRHSDELTDKPHIPQLELELIVSKIEKLYKKSILFNYEHSRPAKTQEKPAEEKTSVMPEAIKKPEAVPPTTTPDFKNLMSINQRFQFTSELFGGSN